MKFGWETILIFAAAALLIAVVAWVMHLKTRGVLRIVINSLAGGALIAGLSAFNIISLPLNAFNAVLVGVLGLPGAGIVVAAALLL
ncbi:MAG: pro-sigmaK processing inhibitor BofA family protein [Clostridiales bacterium]|nr:pro-sigmaK processing inhibitor BofA family protein [Clostridiales bacterium]